MTFNHSLHSDAHKSGAPGDALHSLRPTFYPRAHALQDCRRSAVITRRAKTG
jgi:hypothetical protein